MRRGGEDVGVPRGGVGLQAGALKAKSGWHLLSGLSLDQERSTHARVSYLINQPRTFGLTTRINVR